MAILDVDFMVSNSRHDSWNIVGCCFHSNHTKLNDILQTIVSVQLVFKPIQWSPERFVKYLNKFITFIIFSISASDSLPESVDSNYGHIAMTYVALCSLIILGDDLSGIDRFDIYVC